MNEYIALRQDFKIDRSLARSYLAKYQLLFVGLIIDTTNIREYRVEMIIICF